MKTVCVDAGNTLVKIALMEDGAVRSLVSVPVDDTHHILSCIASLPPTDACILSSVSIAVPAITDALSRVAPRFLELTAQTPLPIHNLYKTPETLGKDRLAAVVGARSLFPERDILVLDAGTALTIDFIDRAGNYHGGNISPGLTMRFRALHEYTRKLPLQQAADTHSILGDTTASAIISGVQNGIVFEIIQYIDHFTKKYPSLVTIMTGGDAKYFADKIEKHTFAALNLIFIGLEKIVQFNFSNSMSGIHPVDIGQSLDAHKKD
jgi:type III pantothenate kinase